MMRRWRVLQRCGISAWPWIACAIAAIALGCASDRPEREPDASDGAAAGCCAPAGEPGAHKPTVVATTMQVGDLVRQIAGDRVSLKVLMSPGVDPHLYEPTAADLAALAAADLVLYNGLGIEGKMVDLLERELADRSACVTSGVSRAWLIYFDVEGTKAREGGSLDGHLWFDMRLWKMAADVVARELTHLDGDARETYHRNLEQLKAEMDDLADYVREKTDGIPDERRILISSHNALAYFGNAFGFRVFGLQDMSTAAPATSRNIDKAVDLIIANRIPAVFTESSVPTTDIDRVVSLCKTGGATVRGGKGAGLMLYTDAMGAEGERDGYEVHTYVGMMKYNVDTIVKGLIPTQHGWTGRGVGRSCWLSRASANILPHRRGLTAYRGCLSSFCPSRRAAGRTESPTILPGPWAVRSQVELPARARLWAVAWAGEMAQIFPCRACR